MAPGNRRKVLSQGPEQRQKGEGYMYLGGGYWGLGGEDEETAGQALLKTADIGSSERPMKGFRQ